MNGVHDMGGLQGFGPVQLEADEPLFHADWERRALGLTLAMGATGQWNIDLSRAARESLPPATYLGSSYYEIWIRGLEKLMLQRGLVSPDELQRGEPIDPPRALARVLKPDQSTPRCSAAARPRGRPRAAAHALPPATACVHATCTRRATPGCRATCAARWARSRWSMAATCSPTATPPPRPVRPSTTGRVAVHRGLRRPRPVGARRRTRHQRVGRRLGALPRGGPVIPALTTDHPACDLPGLPRDDSGPVFSAPWQAQAFALALALHERGAFTWPEWAAALTAAIRRAQAAGDPDHRRHLLPALAGRTGKPGHQQGTGRCRAPARAGTCLGSRRRTHAARAADRAERGRARAGRLSGAPEYRPIRSPNFGGRAKMPCTRSAGRRQVACSTTSVGAGSAGVLASRLSEDPSASVCLIEAGHADRSVLIHCPAGLAVMAKQPQLNWASRPRRSPA
jgi:nitrile hydratase accessory protein